ncbi:MAG: Fe-S cluster assembly ATPase SufC [Desulfurococcales archaeon]|nr:Fe-S cluster assembly ATPase SufC [Desulfurococcales archaeon]
MSLEIRNLTVEVEGKPILDRLSLYTGKGELHAIMGPNGSGKSTLAYAITGKPGYEIVEGSIVLDGEDITSLEPEERALKGVFLGFQEPPPLPGIKLSTLVIAALNKRRGASDLTKLTDMRDYKRLLGALETVGLPKTYASRELHVGFSGGEKKRAEMAQALVLDPKLVVLDEPDSGLDVEGVARIAGIIDELRSKGKTLIVITHYARIFKHVKPDKVSILYKGRIKETGGPELAEKVEEEGYNSIIKG